MDLTESDVSRLLNSKYAQRGDQYQRDGRVEQVQRTDDGLVGQVQGSRADPYKVEAFFEDGAYHSSQCSCPMSAGCKHVAALLYEAIRNPDPVSDRNDLRAELLDTSKSLLVDLVVEYVQQSPDFDSWLRMHLDASTDGDQSVDRGQIESRVSTILNRAADGAYQSHRAGSPLAFDEFDELIELAQVRQDAGEYHDAIDLAAPVAFGLADHSHWFDRFSDDFMRRMTDATDVLVDILEDSGDESVRSRALDELWDLWTWDTDSGGILFDAPFMKAFLDLSTEAEKQWLVDMARDAIEQRAVDTRESTGFGRDWSLTQYGYLIVELAADDLSDDEIVDLVESARLHKWWVRELLERGEVDRAMRVAGERDPTSKIEMGEIFLEEGYDDIAEQNPEELIWYYLEDDDLDAAMAIWKQSDESTTRQFNKPFFARHIADSYPDEAIQIYRETAEELISQYGRSNYREACRHLEQIRDILVENDRRKAWRRTRDHFEHEYSNRPAFQDEMNRAGLKSDE